MSLASWLNKDLIPVETLTTVASDGFYAEFFDDGQLKHFGCYYKGQCELGWRLELERGIEQGKALTGHNDPPDSEVYSSGKYNTYNSWTDNEGPTVMSYKNWVTRWIKRIVNTELTMRTEGERIASWHASNPASKFSRSHRAAGKNRSATACSTRSLETKRSIRSTDRLTLAALSSFKCPKCAHSTLSQTHLMDLPSDQWQEFKIQLYRCEPCHFHAIGWYECNRDDNESLIHHQAFPVGVRYWQSLIGWIRECSSPLDRNCSCHAHQWITRQEKFPELTAHAAWFTLTQEGTAIGDPRDGKDDGLGPPQN